MPRPLTKELEEAGKRAADQINGHLVFNNPMDLASRWMAFALADGSSDGTIYDSILDAKKHTDESRTWYFAFVNCLGGVSARDCAIMLQFHREARDAGINQSDPTAIPFLSVYGGDIYRAAAARKAGARFN